MHVVYMCVCMCVHVCVCMGVMIISVKLGCVCEWRRKGLYLEDLFIRTGWIEETDLLKSDTYEGRETAGLCTESN